MHVKQNGETKDLLAVKINPKTFELSVHQQSKTTAKTIEEIHTDTDSVITFNGSFFTEDFKPTGLLINKGKKLNEISKADLMDGILAIDSKGKVEFYNLNSLTSRQYYVDNEEKYNFAIQNGPILIDEEGEIALKQDTGNKASRTAIGIDLEGNLILIILKQSLLNIDNSITLYEFAHLLKESPELTNLNLRAVLNLDGGSSTGLMIDDKYFPEMEKVQNVVLVQKRAQTP
jgi:uncharacterized protein YigE (DUF2233 family)